MNDTNDATTFAKYQYWDSMDGDAMVCSARGPPEYQQLCFFNQFILGGALTIEGLSLLYNAKRLGRMLSTPVPISVNTNVSSKEGKSYLRHKEVHETKTKYFQTITNALGLEYFCVGTALVVGGSGTIYSTSTFSGLFSDIAFGAAVSCAMYISLLQLRGAEEFQKLVQLSIHSGGETTPKKVWVIHALDVAQGPGAFPITFGIWVLLASGVIHRPALYSVFGILLGAAGIRSMFQNILQRVRTLVRVDELQQNAGGDIRARRRRRNTLQKKARVLIIHLVVILITTILVPISAFVVGSVNSSTQFLIHSGTTHAILSLIMLVVCVTTHKQVDKSFTRQKKIVTSMYRPATDRHQDTPEYTVANESGMSVVGNSAVASVGEGLFSEC